MSEAGIHLTFDEIGWYNSHAGGKTSITADKLSAGMDPKRKSEVPDDSDAEIYASGDLGASRLAGQICRRFEKLDDCVALLLDCIKAFFCDQNLHRLQKAGLLEATDSLGRYIRHHGRFRLVLRGDLTFSRGM